MTKKLFLFVLCSGFFHLCTAQTIRSIPSTKYTPTVIAPSVSAIDAANIILDLVKQYAELKCTETLNKTLSSKIDSTRKIYASKFPKKSVEFLVLADQLNCQVLQIVLTKQTISAKPNKNVCSVDDIRTENPAYIFNPKTTGFFLIKLQF